jgi:diguanylate cyclase (GGDEF)-like protein/PAS domain S-box-containing protein
VIADRSGDIILALEIDGTVRFASASIERTLGLKPEDPVGRPWQALALGADVELLFAAQRFMELAAEETSVAEFRMGKADGSLGYFESHGRATLDADGRVSGFVVVLREISERKAREFDLERAADTDSLTGLLNRRGFIERFERLRSASDAIGDHGCIALFDLDHFKAVNDRHGHAMGDRVLVAFARTVASHLGESDLAGRLGGEEFVAYFSKRRVEDAAMLCEAIRRSFEGQVVRADDGEGGRTTVSVGLAPLSEQQSLNAGLQAADKALYRAKGSGRNRVALAA